jgi:rubrerythrin
MPEFVNPFSGVVPPRKLTDSELVRALRLNLAAEEEAVHLYQAHADATDNELAKKVLLDIADEERVHAGEFQRLLNILLKDEESLLSQGADEVNEMAEGGNSIAETETTETGTGGQIPTVGNLKK